MVQTFESYMTAYYSVGISLKSFKRKKGLCKNLVSICSHAMFLMFISLLCINFVTRSPFKGTARETFFSLFSFFDFNISTLVMVALTLTKKKIEENFWKLSNEAERIFKDELKVNFKFTSFNYRCQIKIIFPTIIQLIIIIGANVSIKLQRPDGFRPAFFGPVLLMHFFIMKFIFYVTVLRFWLKEIEVKMSGENLLLIQMKSLKKVYTLCWKMCSMIEDIFGWGLLLRSFVIFFTTLIAGYTLFVEKAIVGASVDIICAFSTNIFIILLVGGSCQECINCSTSIAPLLFKKSTKDSHSFIQSFALHILHQRIAFKPLNVYEINYGAMISVSCRLH